jgi:membrane protein implicated in regulation of membrane protease activity
MLNKNKSATNANSLIGKDTTLLTPISFDNVGSVKVNGIVWTAIAENDMINIEAGKVVSITAIQGNKLIVKEVNK